MPERATASQNSAHVKEQRLGVCRRNTPSPRCPKWQLSIFLMYEWGTAHEFQVMDDQQQISAIEFFS
jgi:hypothetical protein